MPHHDDKGRISPAQSKAARMMRGTPLSERTMGQMGDRGYGGNTHGRHAYGETHVGISGMTRMSHLKAANKGKKAKSRVILRGREDWWRVGETRGLRKGHQKSEAIRRQMKRENPWRSSDDHVVKAEPGKRSKLKVIARGRKDEKRKAYTKIGARFHKKGLLHVPKVEI